jgi:CO dehydrogenase/acetyl-CoA synthase delta subunit
MAASEFTHVQSTKSPKHEWRIYVYRGMGGNVYIQATEGEVEDGGRSFVVAYGGSTGFRQYRIELPNCKRITQKVRDEGLETMKAELRRLGYIE